MTLIRYHQKRNFQKTPEPRGKVALRAGKSLRYLIQKHDASHLHYDFRLELDGTLKSWAVPKGPSLDPARKALAIQVEDHPIDYGNFEGVIPKGQYGGGTVLLWDTGTWEPLEDPRLGLENGKLRFALHGEKLNGNWSLVRMHGPQGNNGKNWLLIKSHDEYAGTDDILKNDRSVKTQRSLDEITNDRDDVWQSKSTPTPTPKLPKAAAKAATKSAMPAELSPQLAVLADHPPEGDQWLHEIKFDGYRLLAFLKNGAVTLHTRTGEDWTHRFPTVAQALAKLPVDTAIVDGEVVALNAHGQSDFQALQASFKSNGKTKLHYYAFDLPFHNGTDLRAVPLLERKKILKSLLTKAPASVAYSDHVIGHGDAVIAKACALGTEGIVSKRTDSPYVSRRDPTWIKSKCTQRQEFIIIGYTHSEKRREGLRSVLLGYYNAKKELVYAGRAGTGFDEKVRIDLLQRFQKIEQDKSPTASPPPPRERRAAQWLKPTLVCEANFTGWTRDGSLRHPVFMGLRLDKPATQVTREVPTGPAEAVSTKKKSAAKTPVSKSSFKKKTTSATAPTPQTSEVNLTHPDKFLYPEEKITKQDVVNYYQSVAPLILPHIIGRPLALKRCPDGLSPKCFFARNWSEMFPKAIDKINIGNSKKEFHVMINDLPGLLSLVQISTLEIHAWNCTASDLDHPDQLIFDLDPGPSVSWKQIASAATLLQKSFEELKLPVFLKTSGGKGLHLVIPILPTISWDAAKSFCKTIADFHAAHNPLFVSNMRKDLRPGKIYIDYLRNARAAMAVAPYSTRARPGAAVAMPIAWEQLSKIKSADEFTLHNVAAYLKKRKSDPWKSFDASRVDLQKIITQTKTLK